MSLPCATMLLLVALLASSISTPDDAVAEQEQQQQQPLSADDDMLSDSLMDTASARIPRKARMYPETRIIDMWTDGLQTAEAVTSATPEDPELVAKELQKSEEASTLPPPVDEHHPTAYVHNADSAGSGDSEGQDPQAKAREEDEQTAESEDSVAGFFFIKGLSDAIFKFYSRVKNYTEATITCANEGSRMFVPTNDREAKMVGNWYRMRRNIDECLMSHFAFFVGVTYRKDRHIFVTENGTNLSEVGYSKWDREWGQPQGMNERECVALRMDGKYWTTNCSHGLPFFCTRGYTSSQIPYIFTPEDMSHLLSDVPDNFFVPQTCDPRPPLGFYGSLVGVAHAYKLHTHGVFWEDAVRICEDEGGYLAVPNSQREAKALCDIFAYAKHQLDDVFVTIAMHVGISSYNDEGEFRTVYGQLLNETGYSKWNMGLSAPSITHPNSTVVMWVNGPYSSSRRELRLAFFCEKDSA